MKQKENRIKRNSPNKQELEERYTLISSWLISGFSRREVIEKIITELGFSRREAEHTLKRALDYYKYENLTEREKMLQLLLGRYDELFAAASSEKEFSSAINALKEMAKLFNLYDNTTNLNITGEMTFDFGGTLEDEQKD